MPGNPLQYSCLENPMDGGAWWAAVHGVTKSWARLSDFTFIFHFHALELKMVTHSSVLAWRIPGMGEPGGLPYMGLHRVRHDWSNLAAAAHHTSKFLFLSFFYERSSLAPLVGKRKQALQNTSHCHLIVKHVASLLFRQHYIEQYEIIDSWQLLTLRSLKTV